MSSRSRVMAKKWNGDDAFSWAVFVDGIMVGGMCGLNRTQASYYVKQVRAALARKAGQRS